MVEKNREIEIPLRRKKTFFFPAVNCQRILLRRDLFRRFQPDLLFPILEFKLSLQPPLDRGLPAGDRFLLLVSRATTLAAKSLQEKLLCHDRSHLVVRTSGKCLLKSFYSSSILQKYCSPTPLPPQKISFEKF